VVWHLTRLGESRKYKILVGKPKKMRLLGIPESKWDENVKINFGAGCKYIDMI
jgi:hypothetical protein